jgi:hypothetical protein
MKSFLCHSNLDQNLFITQLKQPYEGKTLRNWTVGGNYELLTRVLGYAMAQVVSHWPFTGRPGFAPELVNVGSVVDKVALGQVISEFFSFLLPIQFHHGFPLTYMI